MCFGSWTAWPWQQSAYALHTVEKQLTEASTDDIVEGVAVASICKLAAAVCGALFQALNRNGTEVAGIGGVVGQYGRASGYKAVY